MALPRHLEQYLTDSHCSTPATLKGNIAEEPVLTATTRKKKNGRYTSRR